MFDAGLIAGMPKTVHINPCRCENAHGQSLLRKEWETERG